MRGLVLLVLAVAGVGLPSVLFAQGHRSQRFDGPFISKEPAAGGAGEPVKCREGYFISEIQLGNDGGPGNQRWVKIWCRKK
jgi:hypothetical protein